MKITIKNLEAHIMLGVYPQELVAPRQVIMHISVDYDGTAAAKSDELADALDYGLIEQRIIHSLKTQKFALLEAMAEHVAQLVLDFELAQSVTVEIDKPGALVHSSCVSISHTVSK
ncbi:MAG: dihydroneopterin aldolase [Alphaproteobacteria bacterium]|nr:dihydroneopterin aldolase [Alphaproteobacteria bacterium]